MLDNENMGLDINALTKLHVNFSQKMLVCCWRTHKSISSIFSLIVIDIDIFYLIDIL